MDQDISEIFSEQTMQAPAQVYVRRGSRRCAALSLMVGVMSLYYSACKPWIYENQREIVQEVGIGTLMLSLYLRPQVRRKA